MATRFLNRGLSVTDDPKGHYTPFAFDREDVLHARILNGAGVVEDRSVPIEGIEVATAAKTVTYSDHGKTFIADAAASVIFTLPATRKGITFTFVVKQLPGSGAGTALSPAAVDMIQGNGFTGADNKDAVCVVASDRVGDSMTIVGDGTDGWYITGVTGTWTREA